MMDTGFVVPPEKVSRYAKALPNDPDTGRPQSVFDLTTPTKFECAGGCSVSSAGDYLRFAQMLLDSGKLNDKRILSRKSVELMTADQFTPEIQNNIDKAGLPLPGYSFGLTVAVRPAAGISGLPGSIGDFTWVGAFGTSFWVDKKEQLVIVFMTHTPGPTGLRYLSAIKALALQAIAD